MKFKHSLEGMMEFNEADWLAKVRGRPHKPVLNALYSTPPKIKYLKWKNCCHLFHQFTTTFILIYHKNPQRQNIGNAANDN